MHRLAPTRLARAAANRAVAFDGCVLFSLFLFATSLQATFTAEEEKGFDHFYNLEYDQSIAVFEHLRDAEPDNPLHHSYVAMSYFYKQLHVAGVLQGDLFSASNKFFRTKIIATDPLLESRFQASNQTAISLCEQRLKKDKNDQGALYACGVSFAIRATHQGLITRELLYSMGSSRKANNFHVRLLRLNPRFYDAYLVPGIYDFVVGSLPGALRALLFFVGVSGDKQRGIQFAETVAQSGERASSDAKIVLIVMYRREKRYADARRAVEDLSHSFPRNYILPLEIASLYRAADVFVFPSLYEGFGLPPLEAMANGTPVVTSKISSLPEVVGEAAVTVDPYNVDEIAEAIKSTLADPELRARLIERGRKRAERFSWETAATEIHAVYMRALGLAPEASS